MTTAITYGVSLADHPTWRFGKPELCISVASDDLNWPMALRYIAEAQRGDNPFHYGDTINFGEKIAPSSGMTAFALFALAVLNRDDYTDIDVGETLPVNICGLYPIHDSERRYIHSHGLESFWKLDWGQHPWTALASTEPVKKVGTGGSTSSESHSCCDAAKKILGHTFPKPRTLSKRDGQLPE